MTCEDKASYVSMPPHDKMVDTLIIIEMVDTLIIISGQSLLVYPLLLYPLNSTNHYWWVL